MAKEVEVKFTIEGIDGSIKDLADLVKALDKTKDASKEVGKETKKAGEEATIFSDIKGKFNNLIAPIKKVILSMKTLSGAIAATGIGLLVVALGTLVAYFKSSEEGSKKLAIATETLSLLWGKLLEFASELGAQLVAVFDNPKQAIADFGQLVKDNIIERFNSLMEVLGYVGSALKKFFTGDFSGALEDVKEAASEMIDVVTGVDDSFNKIKDTAVSAFNAIKKAVAEATITATKLINAQRALRDQQQFLIVQNAKLNKELEEQKKIAEDTSLAYDVRAEALDKVGAIQIKLAKNVEAQAAAEEGLLRLQIANANTYDEREELETSLAEAVAARIEAQTALSIVELEAGKLRRELDIEELDRQKGINDILSQLRIDNIDDAFEKAREELALQESSALAELTRARATEAEKTALKDEFKKKREKLATEESNYNKEIAKAEFDAQLNLAKGAFDAIAGLAGENSKIGKAAAIASTVISTYQGAMSAFAQTPGGIVIKSVAAGIATATGLASIKKIAQTKGPGDTGAAAVPAVTFESKFPPINGTAGAENLTKGRAFNNEVNPDNVQKTYVIAEDVTSAQEANKRVKDQARL